MKTEKLRPMEQKAVLGSVKEPKKSAIEQIKSALSNISKGVYLF